MSGRGGRPLCRARRGGLRRSVRAPCCLRPPGCCNLPFRFRSCVMPAFRWRCWRSYGPRARRGLTCWLTPKTARSPCAARTGGYRSSMRARTGSPPRCGSRRTRSGVRLLTILHQASVDTPMAARPGPMTERSLPSLVRARRWPRIAARRRSSSRGSTHPRTVPRPRLICVRLRRRERLACGASMENGWPSRRVLPLPSGHGSGARARLTLRPCRGSKGWWTGGWARAQRPKTARVRHPTKTTLWKNKLGSGCRAGTTLHQ